MYHSRILKTLTQFQIYATLGWLSVVGTCVAAIVFLGFLELGEFPLVTSRTLLTDCRQETNSSSPSALVSLFSNSWNQT